MWHHDMTRYTWWWSSLSALARPQCHRQDLDCTFLSTLKPEWETPNNAGLCTEVPRYKGTLEQKLWTSLQVQRKFSFVFCNAPMQMPHKLDARTELFLDAAASLVLCACDRHRPAENLNQLFPANNSCQTFRFSHSFASTGVRRWDGLNIGCHLLSKRCEHTLIAPQCYIPLWRSISLFPLWVSGAKCTIGCHLFHIGSHIYLGVI